MRVACGGLLFTPPSRSWIKLLTFGVVGGFFLIVMAAPQGHRTVGGTQLNCPKAGWGQAPTLLRDPGGMGPEERGYSRSATGNIFCIGVPDQCNKYSRDRLPLRLARVRKISFS